jgi:hypothetical protein
LSDQLIPSAPGDLRVGRVLNRSFTLLLGDFPKFFAVTLVVWLPYPLFLWLIEPAVTALASDPQHATLEGAVTLLVYLLALIALALLLSTFGPAVILYGAFQRMRGQNFAVAESVARGLSRTLPILGMLALSLLAFLGAGLLLVIPALILMVMWFVALPVIVVERVAPIEGLRRSSFLTQGYGWKIFGIWLLIFIADTIMQQVLDRLLGDSMVGTVGGFLWLVLTEAYLAIVIAVLYYELRVAKEGIDLERIAAVFE